MIANPRPLIRTAMTIGLLMLATSPLGAQGSPPPPRAAGPALDAAVMLAQAAISACRATGTHITVLVVDAENAPVVMLADTESVLVAQQFAPRKTATTIRYKEASGIIAERAKTDAALAAEIKADPKIGFALAGALPLRRDGAVIGAMAVSGGTGLAGDEACAQAAMAQAGAAFR